MSCPQCGHSLPPALVRALTICPVCLRSVALEEPPRLARAEDTTVLAEQELAILRKARKKYREQQ